MIDKNAIREQFRKANKKDNSSRYGLIRMVNNRRKLLDYLKRTNEESYRKVVADLGLRR